MLASASVAGLTAISAFSACTQHAGNAPADKLSGEAAFRTVNLTETDYPDLTYAAESAVDAVVYVEVTVVSQQRQSYDPFLEYFFGFGGGQQSAPREQKGSGSGVIIRPDGYIVTNNHVVANASKVQVTLNNKKTYDAKVIGITGSNGKTVVKEWLYELLKDDYRITRSPKSYNSQIGVPLSVWQMNDQTELAIFEAGISQPGEMERLERIIRPTIGILTNIGTAHAAGFDDQNQKLQEKLALFKQCDVIIYNADIPGIGDALELAGVGARSMAWTRRHKDAQIVVHEVTCSDHDTEVRYAMLGIEGRFVIPMTDEASLENALNCLALMLYLGLSPEDIAQRMQRLTPLAMRLEVVEGKRGCLLINDAYNCDLTSLEMALEFQKRRSSASLKNTLILSDILQANLEERKRCAKLAQLCRLYNISKLFCIGPQSGKHARTLVEELNNAGCHLIFDVYDSTEAFLASPEINRLQNELVLLKGARDFQFERIGEALQLRRHETILEVNLDAIVHNLNRYRSHLEPETKLTCMVKAFGYGTGSYELAKTLQDQNVDYLAVAVADEGADLRRQGIRVPIIVMNPEMSAFRTIIENHLEPEVYSFRLMEAFMAETRAMGVTNYPVHIKIDSGMHRLGFQPHEIDTLIERLQRQNAITVRSVFSHFATADDAPQEAFVHEQKRRFDDCADRIRAAFHYPILRHICNSAGIEKYQQYQMEMCRLGIGLYGFEASEVKMDLEPVAALRSTILQIKDIPATETVGYMRNGKLHRNTRIAMIPIGYADGYDRRLGNGNFCMMVNGHRCLTLGNVCMDVTFLDITDCPDVKEGDSVEIFGAQLPLQEMAQKLGTINYEVLSTVSVRVKRVYYKE